MLELRRLKVQCPTCKTNYIVDFSNGGFTDNSEEEAFCEKDGTLIWKGKSYGYPEVLIDYELENNNKQGV